jgi:hypothetical protein
VPRRSSGLSLRSLPAPLLACSLVLCTARAQQPLFAGVGPEIAGIMLGLRAQRAVSAKPVGSSSLVFKLDLEGPIDAAWRPESRRNPHGHLAEIAAFRLASRLGLDNVAPVVPRSFALEELARLVRRTRPDAWERAQGELAPRAGQVFGAAIYWIPALRELGLDTPRGMERFTGWLSQTGELPGDQTLAGKISSMLAFDYLIANFDRFSGANVQGDAAAQQLYLRDHNLAFREPFRALQHRRVIAHLKRAQRFSRAFVAALKMLPEDGLSGVLADPQDPPDIEVLTNAQIEGVMERRRALLSYIAALIDQHGERNVLTFP